MFMCMEDVSETGAPQFQETSRQEEGNRNPEPMSETPCTPEGHDWTSAGPLSSVGSTLVACRRDGCDEIGYRLTDTKIVAHDAGHEDEGLF